MTGTRRSTGKQPRRPDLLGRQTETGKESFGKGTGRVIRKERRLGEK